MRRAMRPSLVEPTAQILGAVTKSNRRCSIHGWGVSRIVSQASLRRDAGVNPTLPRFNLLAAHKNFMPAGGRHWINGRQTDWFRAMPCAEGRGRRAIRIGKRDAVPKSGVPRQVYGHAG